MRKIAAVGDYFSDEHRVQIEKVAAAHGFSVDFYAEDAAYLPHAADYEVLYGFCAVPTVRASVNLKWFCTSSAGIDIYRGGDVLPSADTLFTNSSGAYGVTIAEHIMMVTLMMMRRMPDFQEIMRRRGWKQYLPMRSICGSRITVLGTGDIGTNFARRAKAMGAEIVRGVRRSRKPADAVYDEMYIHDELDQILPLTDVLVMALPSTAETVGILSRERIALLPAEAYVVNVGRGSAIDQGALVEALNADKLAGAALDVMVPEPLPADSPLWETKNLILTPHCSGNMSLGITRDLDVQMFCEDLTNYAEGRPLRRQVDRKLGY